MDIKEFKRRIILHKFFIDKAPTPYTPFTHRNPWTPPSNILDKNIIRAFIDTQWTLTQPQSFRRTFNITVAQQKEIKRLATQTKLIINKADKGQNIVIQNRTDYINECLRHLNNTKHYTKLQEPTYPSTALKLKRMVNALKTADWITDKELAFLLPPTTPTPRKFYILPKIHKPPHDWPTPFRTPPGRPIVSDIGSESYNISKYLDHFLKPITFIQPSYIKDTFDFIAKIKLVNNLPSNTLLVTCDVESMYTNIDNEDGLAAVNYFFNKYPRPDRPSGLLLHILKLCLANNDFLFLGNFWLQTCGTAMGKIFAPSYANLFMAKMEQDFFNSTGYQPFLYLRYLDDIFIIWTEDRPKLERFLSDFNNFHRSVHVTYTIHEDSIDFLDVTVFKSTLHPNTLDTKVHFKPTNTHRLLDKHSFHPQHTFKGIVKGQIYRFYRLCTHKKHFEEAVNILFTALRNMHYSKRFLVKQKRDLLFRITHPDNMTPRKHKHTLPLVCTYHQVTQNITTELLHTLRSLNSDDLTDTRLIRAFRRNRNLADLLVRNKITRMPSVRDSTPSLPPFLP